MRAVVTQGAGEPLALTTVPDPEPGPGELVLTVSRCGICGSDLHSAETMSGLGITGLVLGHEFCGAVAAVGPGVDGWRVGDRACGFPVLGCRTCPYCVAGMPSKCAAAQLVGFQRPGAFAEHVAVGAAETVRLPDDLDDTAGALIEPLAVAHHALDGAALDPADPVLVLGGGPVGAAVALWARHRGARHVVVSDPAAGRRALCERLGATATLDPTTDDVRSGFERATGQAPATVIECVGVPGLIQHAVDVAATDARVTIVGVCMTPDTINPTAALFKELTFRFVLYYRRSDFGAAIAALGGDRGRRLDPTGMVTAEIRLDEVPEVFEALKRPNDQGKVHITP